MRPDSILVHFPGGDPFDAEIEATWPEADLALLRIRGRVPGTLALALESLPDPGAGVFSLGLPPPVSGDSEPEFVEGEIMERSGDDAFVTTLQVRGGFSGAPVVNHRGSAVGGLVECTERRRRP
jgi:S1-C subfamily serine protease